MFWACKTGYASIVKNDPDNKLVVDAFKKATFFDNCPFISLEIVTKTDELLFLSVKNAKDYFQNDNVKAIGRIVYKMEQIPFYRDLWD